MRRRQAMNGVMIAVTCAVESGSSNAWDAAVAPPVAAIAVATFTVPWVVTSSPA